MAKFTTSTNIIRDDEYDIQYISTPNARRTFKRLISNYQVGHKAFNIIGSYGTGKSSFLWAFEKNLREGKPYFEPLNGQFGGIKKFSFVKIVGESKSLRESLGAQLGCKEKANASEVLKALQSQNEKHQKSEELLVIEIDEFGKFLEHAAKHDPEKELYFIQQLAEFVNSPGRDTLLVTTLHQNFGAYARGLASDQKKEWEKVKGRLIDIAFDEPVEQLLFLASERILEFAFKPTNEKNFSELFELVNHSKLVANSEQLDFQLGNKLFPLDYLSAYILVQALQKYGQNERSLFTFLASQDDISIGQFKGNGTYHIGKVFDYLTQYLTSELEDRDNNPHKAAWKTIFNAIDKVEALNSIDVSDLVEAIKIIGLVNIFSKPLGLLDENVLAKYLRLGAGISNGMELIEKLKSQKIIKYFSPRKKLYFLEGTDLDFEQAYSDARMNLPEIENLANHIAHHVDFNLVSAKRLQYNKGTPRYFQFNMVEFDDLDTISDPENEIDGYIHIVFSKRRIQKKLEEFSAYTHPGHIFVLFKDLELINAAALEIDVIQQVLKDNSDDIWAQKILSEELNFATGQLRNLIMEGIYAEKLVYWIHQGEILPINSYKSLNIELSRIADKAYPFGPIFRNEMVNKEVLSSPILTARKKLIEHLLEYAAEEDIGFSHQLYPPEKTIYLSLLKRTGIHREIDGVWSLAQPTDWSYSSLWAECEKFLKEATHQKLVITELYDRLTSEKFKLKRGFVDFWIPIYLITKQQDFALFHAEQGYIPYLTNQVLDLLHKKPEDYLIKAYEVDGVKVNLFNKYKEITGLNTATKGTQDSFIKVFSNFFIFYNQLPEYTKKTKRLSPATLRLRDAIKDAKDPEQALLEQFPSALGFSTINLKEQASVERFVEHLNAAIYEIRTAFQDLIEIVEKTLLEALSVKKSIFSDYQILIYQRFGHIREHLLTSSQRVLYKRLLSKIDEQEHYIISIADAVIGKNIQQLTDEEVPVLLDRLPEALKDLEKQVPLHNLQEERKEDEVFYFELHKTNGEPIRDKVTLSKQDQAQAEQVEKEILAILDRHKGISKAVLLKLMQRKL